MNLLIYVKKISEFYISIIEWSYQETSFHSCYSKKTSLLLVLKLIIKLMIKRNKSPQSNDRQYRIKNFFFSKRKEDIGIFEIFCLLENYFIFSHPIHSMNIKIYSNTFGFSLNYIFFFLLLNRRKLLERNALKMNIFLLILI